MEGIAMTKFTRLLSVLLLGALALGLGAAGRADGAVQFDLAMVYLELNNGAGNPVDLGLHIKADGNSWKFLRITDPDGTQILDLQNKGKFPEAEFSLRREPPISESPSRRPSQVPGGDLFVRGQTVNGVAMRARQNSRMWCLPGPRLSV
jgi:hypothetical protein